jgi:hypothetical protein
MSAQKGVLHTRGNGKERSQNPVVTSQNPESGGWRLELVLPLDLNQHQQRAVLPEIQMSRCETNRKHAHVILSHAGQHTAEHPRSGQDQQDPQDRSEQNGSEQSKTGKSREVSSHHPRGAVSFFLGCG